MRVHEVIEPVLNAAVEAGLTVHVWPQIDPLPIRVAYITRAGEPGIAIVQTPTFEYFEPVSVSVPVKPSRVYGAAVPQDHDGSVEDIVRLLNELVTRDTVTPRFVGPHPDVPVDVRQPKAVVEYSG